MQITEVKQKFQYGVKELFLMSILKINYIFWTYK